MKVLSGLIVVFCSFSVYSQDSVSFWFNSGKYELIHSEQVRLDKWVSQNKTSEITAISGYTDEVGTEESNDILGQNRALFVQKQVGNKVKFSGNFIIKSYGENFKQDKIQAKNRRATIYYTGKKQEIQPKTENPRSLNEVETQPAIQNPKMETQPTVPTPQPVTEKTTEETAAAVIIPDSLPLYEQIKMAVVGSKIKLKNINFYVNTFMIVPESMPMVQELLEVMTDNPTLHIEIQGHICCVAQDRRNLSLDRAKQVRRYLLLNNIDSRRVQVTGFGTTKPLFPIPEANEEEAAANRRVEIEILRK